MKHVAFMRMDHYRSGAEARGALSLLVYGRDGLLEERRRTW